MYLTDLNFQIYTMGSWPTGVTKWDTVAPKGLGAVLAAGGTRGLGKPSVFNLS